MASRRWTSQFSYSMERQPVRLMMNATITDVGAFATVVTQGITITANTMGSAGNSITIAFTPGATAGAEVVTVTGNAISVQIQTGVSTITQVRTAINASLAAAALVTAVGTSASTVATAGAVSLATGDDTDFTTSNSGTIQCPMTLTQIGTGVFKLALADAYNTLLASSISLQRTAAVDMITQIQSSDVTTAKSVVFRTQTAATPTDLAVGDIIFIALELRNSAA